MADVQIRCRTNLDSHQREEWPRSLPSIPRKGDRVAAKSGKHLAVVQVIHRYDGIVELELHHG